MASDYIDCAGMVRHDMAPRTRTDIMSYTRRSTMGGEPKHHNGSQLDNLAKCFQQHGIASSQEEDDEKIGGEQVHSLLGYVLCYSVETRAAQKTVHLCTETS